MSNIKIRKMQLGDHVGIKKNIFLDTPIDIIENNVVNNVKGMLEGTTNWVYFVAEIDGELVGTAYLECQEKAMSKHIGELYAVATGESYLGQGVCRELMNYVKVYAKDKGIKKLTLSVRQGTPAEIVYQKLGFIKYGELPAGIKDNNEYLNAVYYYIDLN